MSKPRRKLTNREKSRLDVNDVPVLPLKKAAREMSKGNFEEADRLWNLIKDDERNKKR
jgi:hypothetical protein